MPDVCFSGSQWAVLAVFGGVIQAVGLCLFWGWINSLRDSIREARAERDRATTNLELALHIGEATVPPRVRAARRSRTT